MNEMDLKTKIEGLEKAIKEHKDFTSTYESNLKEVQKELEDYNKPELTPMQLDNIQEAIEKAVDEFDFSDADNYDKDFSLDYDGRVQLESLDLTNSYELVEIIVDKVHNLFKEADCPEDDNSQVNTQTVAEKII